MKKMNIYVAEPYRLFFPLGWLMGIAGVSYWILVATGLVPGYLPLYHGLIQIELFAGAFAIGFLLTAAPKFLGAASANRAEIVGFLFLYFGLSGTLLLNAVTAAQWWFIALLVFLIRFAGVRVFARKSAPPYSFLLVAFGILEGFLGALLIIYPIKPFPLLGQKFIEQGMLLSMSLGIGSFLGPRLMGVVDTSNAVLSLPGRAKNGLPWYNSPAAVVFLIGLSIMASFFIETGLDRGAGLYLRALTGAYCLYRFNVLKVPRSESIVGPLAALSLWAMVSGVLAAALVPQHEVAMMHITYIAGFASLILTIGAQVISSHGAVPRFWHVYRGWAICVALLLAFATVIRALATVFAEHYFFAIGLAALFFDIALVIWGVGVLRYIGAAAAKKNLSPVAK